MTVSIKGHSPNQFLYVIALRKTESVEPGHGTLLFLSNNKHKHFVSA